MAKSATILGPYTQTEVNTGTAIEGAIVAAAGSNTIVSAEPFEFRGSLYVLVTTE